MLKLYPQCFKSMYKNIDDVSLYTDAEAYRKRDCGNTPSTCLEIKFGL